METACSQNLEGKLYDLMSIARSLQFKARAIQTRVSGSVPESSIDKAASPGKPTVHQTIDEIGNSLRDATYSLSQVGSDFGISDDVNQAQAAAAAKQRY